MEFTCGLNKERLCKVNELESNKEKCSKSKDRSLKPKHKYWLVVKLKATKYKKNFFLLFIFLL